MITNRTALCRRRPFINLQNAFDTFLGLMLQFPHELTEGKVRDLFAPQAFHTFKVQVFKEQNIKLPTKVYRKFPMMIGSLIVRLFYEYGQLVVSDVLGSENL